MDLDLKKFVERQYMKPKDTIKLQEKRLRKTIKLAYEKSKLYHNKFKMANIRPDDIKTLEDLNKIPFPSKQDFTVNPHGPVGDFDNLFKVHTTSGTSSNIPTMVFFTYNDWNRYVLQNARCLVTAGFTKDDIVYNSTPYGMFFAGQVLHDGSVLLGCFVIPASTLKTGQAHINNLQNPFFKPTGFIGLAQYLLR